MEVPDSTGAAVGVEAAVNGGAGAGMTVSSSVTPGHLAYVSNDVGRPLQWNAMKGEIIGDEEAQNLLTAHPYRSPWVLG